MNDRTLLIMSVGILLLLMVFGSGVVTAGLACGFLTGIGFLTLAIKIDWLRRFSRKHFLLVDILSTVAGYPLFPPGVTAFIAAGTVSIMVTALIAYDRLRHPGEFKSHTITARRARGLFDRVARG